MPNYNHIRLTEELTVPANAVFQDHDTPVQSHVLVSVPVYDAETSRGAIVAVASVQGEAAFALRAFLRGEITFPVIGNGILDIPGGWSARRAAQDLGGGLLRAVGEPTPIQLEPVPNQQVPFGSGLSIPLNLPQMALTPEPPNGIDFSRVLERIKESQAK